MYLFEYSIWLWIQMKKTKTYQLNQKINYFLIKGDKFMPEMHLRQQGSTYSAYKLFTKNKERIQKFKERGHSGNTYQNEKDKVYFQNDLAYWDFYYLSWRTASDRVPHDKTFNIAKNPKFNGY